MPHWDLNGDGVLSAREIERAFVDARMTKNEAAALTVLKVWEAVKPQRQGVSMAELEGIQPGRKPRNDLISWYQNVKMTSAMLRPYVLNASHTLDPYSASQGSADSCAFLSAVVGQALTHPKAIARLITPLPSGHYRVRLGAATVTIKPPTLAEMLTYAHTAGNGMWLSILEKAMAKHLAPVGTPSYEVYRHFSHGVKPAMAIESLTGRDAEEWCSPHGIPDDYECGTQWDKIHAMRQVEGNDLDSIVDLLRDALSAATTDKRLMVGFTIYNPVNWRPMPSAEAHAYTILRYDRDTDTVELRDPRGFQEPLDSHGRAIDGKLDGISSMPLKLYAQRFVGTAVENRSDSPN